MRETEFNKKYRKLLEQNAIVVPDDVWRNLSLQLDMDATEMSFDTEDEELLNDVWANLESELDIDEVWDNISDELDKDHFKVNRRKRRYWVAAAIILLMIGLPSVMQYFSGKTDRISNADMVLRSGANTLKTDILSLDDNLKIRKNTLHAEVKTNTDLAYHPNVIQTDEVNEELQSEKHEELNKVGDYSNGKRRALEDPLIHELNFISTLLDDHHLVSKDNYTSQALVLKLDPKLLLPKNTTVDSNRTEASNKPYRIEEEGVLVADRKDSRWTTGVVTALKNTYLLNAETLEGYSPSGMNESKMTLLPDIGLNVQYAINKRYIFNSNIFLSSRSKQDYNTYSHGEYTSKELQLDYLSGEFAIKQNAKHNLIGSNKIIRRNIAGVYVAHLRSASETLMSQQEDISEKYTSSDYGLMLGQEFEFRSHGPIKVSAGLTIKYGLPNVYKGNSSVPGHLNQTHNASFEFRIGIAYRWSSKLGIDNYIGCLSGRSKLLEAPLN